MFVCGTVLGATQAGTQRAVKQIQMLMAALPESKRPKNVQELKEFVQRYSSFFNKGLNLGPQPTSSTTAPSTVANPSSLFPSSTSASRTQPLQNQSSASVQLQSSFNDTNAHVNEHFAASLSVLDSSQDTPSSSSSSSFPGASEAAELTKQQLGVMHASITTQFNHSAVSQASSISRQIPAVSVPSSFTSVQSVPSSSSSAGIQAGIATPLPPGLTLETLGVLCRLPEIDLQKLKLPAPLMSAIKVWKARQGPNSIKTKVSEFTIITGEFPSTGKYREVTQGKAC